MFTFVLSLGKNFAKEKMENPWWGVGGLGGPIALIFPETLPQGIVFSCNEQLKKQRCQKVCRYVHILFFSAQGSAIEAKCFKGVSGGILSK